MMDAMRDWTRLAISAVAMAVATGVFIGLPVGTAQSTPPGLTTTVTVSGTTVLALDDTFIDTLNERGVRFSAKAPATRAGRDIGLRLAKATDSAFHLDGALVLVGPTGSKLQVKDVVVRRGEAGDIDVTTLVGKLDLMRTESVVTKALPTRKTVKGRVTTVIRTTTYTGVLRLTRDTATVLTLKGALGAYAFSPGQTLGTITTRLVETTTTTRPKPATRSTRTDDPRVTYQVKTKDPVAFITIDDGIITPKAALDYVEKHRIPITSFLISSQVTDSKVRYFERISRWGSVQNHTTTHASLATSDASLIKSQVCPVQVDFRRTFGTKPWMLRPPYGAGPRNTTMHEVVGKCGITDVVVWDAVVDNGRLSTATGSGLVPGSVVLLHYTGNLAWDLKVAVTAIRAAGLRPANLADYLAAPVKRG
ncbi:MAG: hypothetical protein FJW80_00930 [Actinobacteria bacterium]|nr:hypothetical protein [Actinomycetota bacterium]